jgi:hypothetical protein
MTLSMCRLSRLQAAVVMNCRGSDESNEGPSCVTAELQPHCRSAPLLSLRCSA